MEYNNLSDVIIKANKNDTSKDTNYDNLNNYIVNISNVYKHLKRFVEILTIIKKIQILKSDKYDLLIPTESEINLLDQNLKSGNTMEIIAVLSRLIKSKSQSFKIFLDTKYLVQKLNNGSAVYYRYFSDKKKKDKKLDESDKNLISNLTMNNVIQNENFNEMYDQIMDINEKLIKMYLKTDNLYIYEGSNNKKTNELLYSKYIKEKKCLANDDYSDDSDDDDDDSEDDGGGGGNKMEMKNKKMSMSYRNNLFNFLINKFYKNNKSNTNNLNKIKDIMLNNLNISVLTNNNEYLTKTLENLCRKQVNSLVLITVLLQPCSVVDENYIFNLKEIDEFNIKKTLCNKVKPAKSILNNKKQEGEENVSIINTVSCIKLIKKFMKDSTPYNNNSFTNLINHYYTILEDKESVHKLLWLLCNIYFLECIYNEFKNSTSSTYETYVRLLAIKPMKKGDIYLERLKWIIKLFEEQKNTEASLPGLINFCLYVSLKEDNSHIFFGDDSDLDFDNDSVSDLKQGSSEELLF
jgi:hypothetical protein